MKQHWLAYDVSLKGVVQGVGMRPTIWRIATQHQIAGWVLNGVRGVTIHAIVKDEQAIKAFTHTLKNDLPPQARVTEFTVKPSELAENDIDEAGNPRPFEIIESRDDEYDLPYRQTTHVSADLATCPDCLAELLDPDNRRYHYPFINCTNCGPRATVIKELPYDRCRTSMHEFQMCHECSTEYHDPANRRFDAQPDACFICGPQISWQAGDERLSVSGTTVEERRLNSDLILETAAHSLLDGKILAIKGLGGFHLACDATNEAAVATLRHRKHRPRKALACMVADIDAASELGHLSEAEKTALASSAAPIVLLEKRQDAPLAPSVTLDLLEVGVMLPSTPLHHLLTRLVGRPLIMTSGNISGEPICIDDNYALSALNAIADGFVLHDRQIVQRLDDSVVRILDDKLYMIRRARGYAPFPVPIKATQLFEQPADPIAATPQECEVMNRVILATGSEQKNTFALAQGPQVFVSQHIGDLHNAAILESFESTLATYRELLRLDPTTLALDMHPSYHSTMWGNHYLELSSHNAQNNSYAESQQEEHCTRVDVCHHHAHVAAVMAEHDINACIGVAFDGTGAPWVALGQEQTSTSYHLIPDYEDLTIDDHSGDLWGGEFFVATLASAKRVAHFKAIPLVGGERAIKHTDRLAIGVLAHFGLVDHPAAQSLQQSIDPKELQMIRELVGRAGLGVTFSTSCGRLFDAISALLGICRNPTYEGEAAILLEAAAHRGLLAWEYTRSSHLSRQDNHTSTKANSSMAILAEYASELMAQDQIRAMVDALMPNSSGIIDTRALIAWVLDRMDADDKYEAIALDVHLVIGGLIIKLTQQLQIKYGDLPACFSGGTFMNRILIKLVTLGLNPEGVELEQKTYFSRELPQNDGCIAYGQAAVAFALQVRGTVDEPQASTA